METAHHLISILESPERCGGGIPKANRAMEAEDSATSWKRQEPTTTHAFPHRAHPPLAISSLSSLALGSHHFVENQAAAAAAHIWIASEVWLLTPEESGIRILKSSSPTWSFHTHWPSRLLKNQHCSSADLPLQCPFSKRAVPSCILFVTETNSNLSHIPHHLASR